MGTSEITRPDWRFMATSSFAGLLADLSERERLCSMPPAASGPDVVQRTISVRARGRAVQFTYLDSSDPRPTWLVPVLYGFARLVTLPENWDGEGSPKIDRATINRALAAIERLLPAHAPAPSVVPIANSGLQIEWHRNQKDLEIEFSPTGEVGFYYLDQATGEEREGPLGPDFVHLRDYLQRLW